MAEVRPGQVSLASITPTSRHSHTNRVPPLPPSPPPVPSPQLGMDGVFVGSGIFKSGDPAKRARAIVQAVTHYNNPQVRGPGGGGSLTHHAQPCLTHHGGGSLTHHGQPCLTPLNWSTWPVCEAPHPTP